MRSLKKSIDSVKFSMMSMDLMKELMFKEGTEVLSNTGKDLKKEI